MYDEKNYDRPFSTNAVMGCRKKHPFFKYVLDRLGKKAVKSGEQDSTGPMMLDDLAHKYIKETENVKEEDRLFLAPPDYFLPTWDWRNSNGYRRKCNKIVTDNSVARKKLREHSNRERLKLQHCKELLSKGFKNEPKEISYTNHLWQHTYVYNNYTGRNDPKNIHIKHLVPQVNIISFKK